MHPYASKAYAECFEMESLSLSHSEGRVLKRPIPGTPYFDAMGCYPLAALNLSPTILEDFKALASENLVSLTLVTDPFSPFTESSLRQYFDHVVPFKPHFILDLTQTERKYSKHHRYEIRRAQQCCTTKIIVLKDYLEEWYSLYEYLINEHQVKGIAAFSKRYFEQLAAIEDFTTIGAFDERNALISAHIWLGTGDYAYSHLAASSKKGYKLRAAYAVNDFAIQHFAHKKMIDFGGAAGTSAEADDGLARFKRGFCNTSKTNFIAGKILNPALYQNLTTQANPENPYFFPLYRG